eukprot:TRINITY_DN17208_c0_g1_i6.p1 TRINITY_DN17208_c0_g1~~TRINITY_DN17208_c0_g1_i6.p1  ORF type:complete len:330 (+),score=68.67 TRINITY_DN17208_c0_g1_i6:63-992(+)
MGSACTRSEAAGSDCSSFCSDVMLCDNGNDDRAHIPQDAVKWKLAGTGTFGKVMKCTNKDGGVFASKISKLSEIRREVACAKLLGQEAGNHHLMNYRHSDLQLNCGCGVITYDFQPGLPLLAALLKMKFTESDVAGIINQCLEALVFMHDRDLIHMDVKPENILVEPSTGNTCLVDYSTATLRTTVPKRKKGFTMYSAPEVVSLSDDDVVPCTPAFDMWAIGAVSYHCLAGVPPFSNPKSIMKGDYPTPPSLVTTISPHSQSFIASCLEIDPEKRLDSVAARKHTWFSMKPITTSLALAKYNIQFPYDV